MMKHVIALVSLMGIVAGEAVAADIGVPPNAAVPAQLAPWTGFHVGVVGGWARGTASQDAIPTSPFGVSSGDFSQTGWLAGGTVGYDWQFGMFDVGVEADISGASIDGNVSTGLCTPIACRTKINWLHTGRARLGVTFGQVMPYLTGGVAFAGLKAWNASNSTNSEPGSVWGGLVGGGLEWLFLPNWSAKAEYIFVPSFGTTSSSDIFATLKERNISLVRFGVNYHFGEDVPLTARY